MKVVINVCFGGFGLSEDAYEKLIEWGIPSQKHFKQQKDKSGRYLSEPRNNGEVIFDSELGGYKPISGRYWDSWLRENRTHPLLIRVVEKLGKSANGMCASLKVVEIPDDIEWEIDEYDGSEHIAEKHRTWG